MHTVSRKLGVTSTHGRKLCVCERSQADNSSLLVQFSTAATTHKTIAILVAFFIMWNLWKEEVW
jgi:hypothetical protein